MAINKKPIETRRLNFLKDVHSTLRGHQPFIMKDLISKHHLGGNARKVLILAGLIQSTTLAGKRCWLWSGPVRTPDMDTVALFDKHTREYTTSYKAEKYLTEIVDRQTDADIVNMVQPPAAKQCEIDYTQLDRIEQMLNKIMEGLQMQPVVMSAVG